MYIICARLYSTYGVSVSYGGKGGGRRRVSLFQGEQRVISTPGRARPPRLIVRPGWWTFSRMEREMECGIVEPPSSIPRDPITSNPNTHPLTQTDRVQVPPMTWATVILAVGDGTVALLFGLTSLRGFSERVLDDLQTYRWLFVSPPINRAI